MQKNNPPLRIGILGIYHESNTFLKEYTEFGDFAKGHLFKGDAIIDEYRSAYHEIGGMIEVLENKPTVEIVPVYFAEATPGGIISASAFDQLFNQLMSALELAMPLDGLLVAPHGAGVSENHRDMDGYWLSKVRAFLGNEVPIAGTLDPHANVSQLMIDSTNALVAYATNPHVDQRQTGKQAAEILLATLHKKIFPLQVLNQPAATISIEQQNTNQEPCLSLYQKKAVLDNDPNIISISILLGFPYADVEEMGTSFIVISNAQKEAAIHTGEALACHLLAAKRNFNGDKSSISTQWNTIDKAAKPILLLDMGDNVGGGSPGNSTFLLQQIERVGKWKAFACIHCPEAVQTAFGSVDNGFLLSVDDRQSGVYQTYVKILKLADGKFHENLPRHGGQTSFDMGKIAIVLTEAGSIIMLTTNRIAPFSLNQLLAFGIVPAAYDIIIAKGVNAPIAAYSPVCPTIIQVDTPGVTGADMTKFDFKFRRKPLYPFEN